MIQAPVGRNGGFTGISRGWGGEGGGEARRFVRLSSTSGNPHHCCIWETGFGLHSVHNSVVG